MATHLDHSKFIRELKEVKSWQNSNEVDRDALQLEKVFQDFDNLNQSQEEAFKRAQELTNKYDEYYETCFRILEVGGECALSNVNGLPYSENAVEDLFLILTYLRRHRKGDKFRVIYEIVEEDYKKFAKDDKADFFMSPMMQPFYFNYIEHSKKLNGGEDFKDWEPLSNDKIKKAVALFDEKRGLQKENKFFLFTNVKYSDSIRKILENIDFDLLSKNDREWWGRCLQDARGSIKIVLDTKNLIEYPLYHYIKARLDFLMYNAKMSAIYEEFLDRNLHESGKKKIETKKEIELDAIRNEVRVALEAEQNQNKKMRYLSFLMELDRYEVIHRIDSQQEEVKQWEKKSLKILSAFAAFVVFAIGLISGVTKSNFTFQALSGGFFLLLGIALIIFYVLDVIVLEDITKESLWKGAKDAKNRKRAIKIKSGIILGIAILAIIAGCLMGYGVIPLMNPTHVIT